MSIKLNWIPDLHAEQEMTRLGISWEVKTIPFSKINLKDSRVNEARLFQAILPEVVEDYAEAMESGDAFPRLLLTPAKAGPLILWGNQRSAAIERLIQARKLPKSVNIEVYLTEELDAMYRQVLIRSGNVSHGARSSREERLQHAIFMVEKYGMNKVEASRAFNVAQATLRQHLQAEAARRNMQSLGIPGVEGFPHKTCLLLSRLEYDESSQKKLAYLLTRHPIERDRLDTVIKTLKAKPSQEKRLEVIKSLEEQLAKEAKAMDTSRNGKAQRPLSRPRRHELLTTMEKLVRILEKGNAGEAHTTLETLQFTGGDDVEQAKKLAGKIMYRLRVLKLI